MRSRRAFSPSLRTNVWVTGGCPAVVNVKVCSPGIDWKRSPVEFRGRRRSVRGDAHGGEIVAHRCLASKTMVGWADSSSSRRRVQ